MREFSSVIDLFHASDVQSVFGSVVTLKPGCQGTKLGVWSELILDAVPETTDAGILYSIQENIVIEKVPDNVKLRYRTPQPVILQVHTTGSDKVTIGSPACPAKVSIAAHLQNDKLNLISKNPESPF